MKRIIVLCFALVLLFTLAACGESEPKVEAFPTDTVTIVVCHGAGGGTDVAARMIAPYLAEELGVNVVVENVTGGNGINGHLEVINRGADGYTIAASNCISHIVAPMIYDKPYSAAEDFISICATGNASIFLAAGPEAPAQDLDGLIAYAKENPGTVTISCAGLADVSGISAARAMKAMGAECTLIPYDSAAEAAAACAGGHVMLAASTYSGVSGFVTEGTLTVLLDATGGVETPKYDVPSVSDITGSTDDDTLFYRTMAVPAGTPDEVVKTLRDAYSAVMTNEKLLKEFEDIGDQIVGFMDGATMQKQVEADTEAYTKLVLEMNLVG